MRLTSKDIAKHYVVFLYLDTYISGSTRAYICTCGQSNAGQSQAYICTRGQSNVGQVGSRRVNQMRVKLGQDGSGHMGLGFMVYGPESDTCRFLVRFQSYWTYMTMYVYATLVIRFGY